MYFRGQSLEAPVQSPKRVLPIIDVPISTSVKEVSSHGLGDGVLGLFPFKLPYVHELVIRTNCFFPIAAISPYCCSQGLKLIPTTSKVILSERVIELNGRGCGDD